MSFDDEMIQKVWEKGKVSPKHDKDKYRKDQCGAWIERDKYGDRKHNWGWEIDHIEPKGSDELSNLRPLQWENNVATSDKGQLECVKP
ncbi:MAG: HNH endonuclease [Candidatus Bathyarchaeota archaeon]|nr:HNH endonuclease [Candidatus Bathyarchaeota archaeon]